jgi:predicted extracellular nuclease
MKKFAVLSCISILLTTVIAYSTQDLQKKKKSNRFRVMFYNVENLYDTENDPRIDDEEFLPGSESNWTPERLSTKLNHIAQVIETLGKEQLPDVVGFAEVENRNVLDYLLTRTDLKKQGYSIVHYDSPDKRGIDVGLIYRTSRFSVIKSTKYPVIFPGESEKPTRDILYVKGLLPNKAPLHVLVNHWPSRSGGELETEPKRIQAAKTAKRLCDSIQFNEKNANIILVGDFNDYPGNKSMVDVLQASGDTTNLSSALYNLMAWQKGGENGSHQYKGEWGFLDQVILSQAIMKGDQHLKTWFSQARVFRADFLIEKNEKFNNYQPKRTYGGKKYLGGYSDHLPVYVDLYMN